MEALIATLALLRLEGLGTARYWSLIEHYGSPVSALQDPPQRLLQQLPSRAQAQWRAYLKHPASGELLDWAEQERARCAALGIHILHHADDAYPALLAEVERPPPLLYVRGNADALHLPQIAIVGARRATTAALENARAFATDLAGSGFAVTSGLALGIDAAAHSGALEARGVTLAVMGTGIDRVYPRRNQALAEQILAADGALVSELPLGRGPEASNFPRRNRIISGLSLGVLLVEAAVKSGSLITARLAAEQNREVFAIPGPIHHPLSRGCHQMIKQGAHLVETSADIVAQLGGLLTHLAAPGATQAPTTTSELPDRLRQQFAGLETLHQRLMGALAAAPRSLEQLAAETGDETGTLMASLLSLELEGLVEQLPGGYQLTGKGAQLLQALPV